MTDEERASMEEVAYGLWAVRGSIIRVGQVDDVRTDGMLGRSGCDATLAICLCAEGNWQPIWQTNGDWSMLGDTEEECETAASLGGMDQSEERTRAEAIEAGADEIDAWATKVAQLDEESEALAACAEWMREQAYHARTYADTLTDEAGEES